MIRSSFRRLAVVGSALVATAAVAAPAQAAPYCGLTWGSTAETRSDADPTDSFVDDVRSGRHACFDRLVIDVGDAGSSEGYDVRYVSAVRTDGAGERVPLRGGAFLQVVVRADVLDADGDVRYEPAPPADVVDVRGYSTFRQVAWAGSFEGQTTLGVGVRARLPFRVLVLPATSGNDTRVVIDVAHRW
jgi:hypothetical protein